MQFIERAVVTGMLAVFVVGCGGGGGPTEVPNAVAATLSPTATPSPPAETSGDDWVIEVLNRHGPFEMYSVYIGTADYYYLGTVPRSADRQENRFQLPSNPGGLVLILKSTDNDDVVQTLGVEAPPGTVMQLTVDRQFRPLLSGGVPAN
jgi:hypothetical protein